MSTIYNLQPCYFELQKHIKDFPLYTVTHTGNLRSLHKNIYLSPSATKPGYASVFLYADKVGKRLLVHRIVLSAFRGVDPNKTYVDHKDNNPRNNNLSNLHWVTQSENIQKSYDLKRSVSPRAMTGKFGKLHHRSKEIVGYKDGKEVIRFESISLARAGGYILDFYKKESFKTQTVCKGILFKKTG